jgi:putative membrane protein
MEDKCLQQATFNPKVKSYWILSWVFVSALTIVGIAFIPIVAIIVWIIAGKMLDAMSARLLERKLVVKRGIVFVVEKSIPLEKITDVALSQGPIMRLFGIYQLSFETAGQSAAGALVSLIGINDADAFREAILKQKDKIAGDKPQTIEDTSSNGDIADLTQSVQNIEKMLATLLDEKQKMP